MISYQDKILRKNLYVSAKRELYRRDFPLFCAEQLRIISKAGSIKGNIPFVFNKGQKKIWTQIHAFRKKAPSSPLRVIILKARQIGASTMFQALGIHRTIFNGNVTALTMAHDSDSTENIHRMAKLFYRSVDGKIKPSTQYDSKKGYEFRENNSRLLIQTAGNVNAGASFTINYLHLSEAARYRNPDLLDTSFFPSIPNNSSSVIVIESTAKTTSLDSGKWFREMWDAAETEGSRWLRIFIPWFFTTNITNLCNIS